MTATPEVLLETPPAASDALSDLLDRMHLAGMVLFRAEFHEPWAVTTPDSCQLAQVLPFHTEHITPFHIVASGGCWMEMPGSEPVWLKAGDAILLPYGNSHCLSGKEPAEPVSVGQLLPNPPWSDILAIEYGGAGAETSIICGFLQCDALLFQPILRHLPTLLHVGRDTTGSENWLSGTIRHTAAEASKRSPGGRSILPRLTELMFVEILRQHMQTLPPDQVGWLAAYNDMVVGTALRLLHTEPYLDWTVATLACRVGVSRTVLAERFKHFLDVPPMQYLIQWRLRLAAQQLKSSDVPIKIIAEQTGYDSEAAFSRAFKRQFELPPGEWRAQQGGNSRRHVTPTSAMQK